MGTRHECAGESPRASHVSVGGAPPHYAALVIVAGLVLIILGTLVTVATLVTEWRTHRKGEPIVPVRAWATSAWRKARRRKSVAPVTAHGVADLGGSGTTTAPRSAANPSVDQRIAALSARLDDLTAQLSDARAAALAESARHDERADRLAREVTELCHVVRNVATGTIRWELVGITLVGLGTFISTIPSL